MTIHPAIDKQTDAHMADVISSCRIGSMDRSSINAMMNNALF
eukprot:CAMPEP_0171319524 /NCGR_PEP_ID=MMETSP0816-20121228/97262_1 /TAXON_ID=420281 /ORGANISM="Proboscia inermis, Strain CCAP1064/1" /LENGTH=41 /DNA_ID= /DNA_START= /DNA_END= /DNA_ORIENTATION=